MGGATNFRAVLVAGGVLAGACGAAFAQDAAPSSEIDFTDPHAALGAPGGAIVNLSVHDDVDPRFTSLGSAESDHGADRARRLELEVAAGGEGLDVAFAQRASLGADGNGDLDRRGRGSEVRIGRGLVAERGNDDRRGSSVYAFVASDDEALTWRPGARNEFGGRGSAVMVQDQVEIGDLSAGVTYENNGVRASLAYVEREESARVGGQTYSQDESFTGVTLTVRNFD